MGTLFRIIFTVIGVIFGFLTVNIIEGVEFLKAITDHHLYSYIGTGIIILFGIIFFILAPWALRMIRTYVAVAEDEIKKRPISDLVFGTLGLVVGLVLAYLISIPLYQLTIPVLGSLVSILVYMVLGYLGVKLATSKRGEISDAVRGTGDQLSRLVSSDKEKIDFKSQAIPKVLDTSVIIDGRIADVAQIGFMQGPLLVPIFVLQELQHIADSPDRLKRNRGRRGLDILNAMQDQEGLEVIITEETYDEVEEVDAKLIKMAKDLGGVVVTNDYNLNKVAQVQGIEVLNINDLANAVKPVVIPGESMTIHVVKEGKEVGQGLAYLDDGTMIVVEDGIDFINQTLDVVVTSVLQTSAGKMIFARPKEA